MTGEAMPTVQIDNARARYEMALRAKLRLGPRPQMNKPTLDNAVLSSPPPLRGRKTRLDFCTSQKSNLPRQVGGVSPRVPLLLPPTPALPLKGGGRELRKKVVGQLIAATLACSAALAVAAFASPPTPYAGEQNRGVASLEDDEVAGLVAGRGMGLAKPAELNGYPGPAHVLELADSLNLSSEQRAAVQASFDRMAARAKIAGAAYVDAERALDDVFRSGKADPASVAVRLADAEKARAEKRMAHIAAHLEITPLLTPEQRRLYAELRGYTSSVKKPAPKGSHGGSASGSGTHVAPKPNAN
jgi:Spy/CpxP family protein refolding chaperone